MNISLRLLLPMLVVGLVLPLFSQTPSKASASRSALIERGRYLVEQVGMCQDCHTPMNEKGEFVRERYLMGATIPFKPVGPVPAWAEQSPRIAGLPGWSEEDAIRFFMTGQNMTGGGPRPPMPPYRFNRQDAAAITAYLKSLTKSSDRAAK